MGNSERKHFSPSVRRSISIVVRNGSLGQKITLWITLKTLSVILIKQHNIKFVLLQKGGPVAQHGWSVRLIIERSAVQIRLGPPPIHTLSFCERLSHFDA